MSNKRRTREQKLHAQEKRLKASSISSQNNASSTHTYSITIPTQVSEKISPTKTIALSYTHNSQFVTHDLYKSIVTASAILVMSALLSFVIKRTDFLSLIHI